jgi:hypothetical protein
VSAVVLFRISIDVNLFDRKFNGAGGLSDYFERVDFRPMEIHHVWKIDAEQNAVVQGGRA